MTLRRSVGDAVDLASPVRGISIVFAAKLSVAMR